MKILSTVYEVRITGGRHISLLIFALLGLFLAGTASAQAQDNVPPPPPPPGTGAGQIEQHFEGGGVGAPTLRIPVPVVDDDQLTLPDNAEELSLSLTQVVIEGSTVYTKDELSHLYKNRIGQKIALAEVFRIAEEITAKYRNDGYILSRAVVPPQTIDDGSVRIDIVEGFINDVLIEGEVPTQQSLLIAYGDKILNSRPLSTKDLERYLLLIRDLPGIKSEATIRPATDTPGASDLVILVEYKKMDGFVRLDNRGSKFNGPARLWLGAGFNSLSDDFNQRMTLTFATAGEGMKELDYYDLGYEHHIGTEGKKLYFNLTSTGSKPGHTLRDLEIDSKSQSFKFGISNPLIRSRTKNLSLYADFVVRNSETKFFNNRLSKDRVRFISLGALYDYVDRFGGISQLGLRLDQGMDILNASKEGSTDLSRANGQVDFTKLLLTASRLQRLNDSWSFFTDLRSQFTSSKLLASEEFGVGGERCVRAYDPSEVTGDRGTCLLLEMRYGQNTDSNSLVGYQLFAFYDVGVVKRINPGALGKKAKLSSYGFGTRVNYRDWLSGSFEIAWPRIKEVDSRALDVKSSRLFLNLTARF